MVVEAAPSSPLEMPKPDLLLELLIIAFNAPAQLGQVDQRPECDVLGKSRKPVFGWFVLALRPLDQQPLFRSAGGQLVVAMRDASAHAGKMRGQLLGATLAPSWGTLPPRSSEAMAFLTLATCHSFTSR